MRRFLKLPFIYSLYCLSIGIFCFATGSPIYGAFSVASSALCMFVFVADDRDRRRFP